MSLIKRKGRVLLAPIFFLVFLLSCTRSSTQREFTIVSIEKKPVGKRTIRYRYLSPFIFLIQRNSQEKNTLVMVRYPSFDTFFLYSSINLEYVIPIEVAPEFVRFYIGADTIPKIPMPYDKFRTFYFLSFNLKDSSFDLKKVIEGWGGFKGFTYVALLQKEKNSALLFLRHGRLRGVIIKHHFDTNRVDTIIKDKLLALNAVPVGFDYPKLYAAGVLASSPISPNDLVLKVLDLKSKAIIKKEFLFTASDIFVQYVFPMNSSLRFLFIASEKDFPNRVFYVSDNKVYPLIYTGTKAVPFISGKIMKGRLILCYALSDTVSSIMTKHVEISTVKRGKIEKVYPLKLPKNTDFVYPPYTEISNDTLFFFFSIFNKHWRYDTLYIIKGILK